MEIDLPNHRAEPRMPLHSDWHLINPSEHVPFKQRLGRCYELAGEITAHNPEVTLIHGSIQGLGFPRLPHAWVVLPDDTVWEPATNKIWSRTAFEGFYRPKIARTYANRAALEQMVRHEHYGPWH